MNRGTAVGEIQSTTSLDTEVVFLGVASPKVTLSRAVLEAAGIRVIPDEFFTAEVDFDAETPDQLQPNQFAPQTRDSELELVWGLYGELWAN